MQQEMLLELSRRLSDCPYLSGEWSLKLHHDRLDERKKIIYWIDNANHQANRWIDLIRPLLPLDNLIEYINNNQIFNLGFGIGDSDPALYVHCRINGQLGYLAVVNGRLREYSFHYFPITSNLQEPDSFIDDTLQPLFNALKQYPLLQAVSGFWLRRQAGNVDQVSLSYIDRPQLHRFADDLKNFTGADLIDYQHEHLKHIAFNRQSEITIYFSGKISQFPIDFNSLRQAVWQGANTTHLRLQRHFSGLSLATPAFDISLPTKAQQSNWESANLKLRADHLYPDEFCRHINNDENVYVISSRFAEEAIYLKCEKHCDTHIAVASMPQFIDCNNHGQPCRLIDYEASIPADIFDTILLAESLELVKNKAQFLNNLRSFTRKLVIRTAVLKDNSQQPHVAGGRILLSKISLIKLLQNSGYIVSCVDTRTANSLCSIDITPVPSHNFYLEWQSYIKIYGNLNIITIFCISINNSDGYIKTQ